MAIPSHPPFIGSLSHEKESCLRIMSSQGSTKWGRTVSNTSNASPEPFVHSPQIIATDSSYRGCPSVIKSRGKVILIAVSDFAS